MNAGGVGGARISAGVVPEGGVFAAARYPTPRSPKKLVETMVLGQRVRARPPSRGGVQEAVLGPEGAGLGTAALARDADGASLLGG